MLHISGWYIIVALGGGGGGGNVDVGSCLNQKSNTNMLCVASTSSRRRVYYDSE